MRAAISGGTGPSGTAICGTVRLACEAGVSHVTLVATMAVGGPPDGTAVVGQRQPAVGGITREPPPVIEYNTEHHVPAPGLVAMTTTRAHSAFMS